MFVFDWKIMWKKYDQILWAWLLEWWWVYIRVRKEWENVFILNWTERRRVDDTNLNDYSRGIELFTR